MLNQRRYGWVGLALILILTACGTDDGTGTIGAGIAADDTEQADTTDTSSGTSEAGTQTDDDTGTSEAGTQTDDESGTSDAGTQTDDESGTSDAGTQTDDDTTDDDTSDDDATDDDTGNTDVDPDADTETDTETDTGDADTTGYDLNGKWEGSYTCSQGFTRVTLQIVHDSETNTLDTVFAFFADDSNPDVPTGRFTMDGSYTPDTQGVELLEDAWIEQPGGYIMISLSGTLDPEANVISGTVLESGCSTFSVARGG